MGRQRTTKILAAAVVASYGFLFSIDSAGRHAVQTNTADGTVRLRRKADIAASRLDFDFYH